MIGFTTAYADYILMNPSEDYAEIMATVHEKIYLSKIVIEFLEEHPNATYEDLLNKIQVCMHNVCVCLFVFVFTLPVPLPRPWSLLSPLAASASQRTHS